MVRSHLLALWGACAVLVAGGAARAANECGYAGHPCCIDASYTPYCYYGLECTPFGVCAGPLFETYSGTLLVADLDGVAPVTDPALGDSWAVVAQPAGGWLVANAGTQTVTGYDAAGKPTGTVIQLGGRPTGGAYNGDDAFFLTDSTGASEPARYLWAGEDGRIYGVPAGAADAGTTVQAAVLIDNSAAGASYTGLAVLSTGDAARDRLYAADPVRGVVDVWDAKLRNPGRANGGFASRSMGGRLPPYGVQVLDGQVWVAYAEHDGGVLEVSGRARVAIFDPDGNPVEEIVHPALDAPWGIAKAPTAAFGDLNACVLIGNVGDGRINAFCRGRSGRYNYEGPLADQDDDPVILDSVRGIAFGRDPGSETSLAFTARTAYGPSGLTAWVLGVIGPRPHVCTCACNGQYVNILTSFACEWACLPVILPLGCTEYTDPTVHGRPRGPK